MNSKVWQLSWDATALLISTISLAAVVFKSMDLPLLPMLVDTTVGEVLTSKTTKSLIDVLCGGVVGAYVFYLMVENFQRAGKKSNPCRYLTSL